MAPQIPQEGLGTGANGFRCSMDTGVAGALKVGILHCPYYKGVRAVASRPELHSTRDMPSGLSFNKRPGVPAMMDPNCRWCDEYSIYPCCIFFAHSSAAVQQGNEVVLLGCARLPHQFPLFKKKVSFPLNSIIWYCNCLFIITAYFYVCIFAFLFFHAYCNTIYFLILRMIISFT